MLTILFMCTLAQKILLFSCCLPFKTSQVKNPHTARALSFVWRVKSIQQIQQHTLRQSVVQWAQHGLQELWSKPNIHCNKFYQKRSSNACGIWNNCIPFNAPICIKANRKIPDLWTSVLSLRLLDFFKFGGVYQAIINLGKTLLNLYHSWFLWVWLMRERIHEPIPWW